MKTTLLTANRIKIAVILLLGVSIEIFIFNIRHFELPFFGNDTVAFSFPANAVSYPEGKGIQIEINRTDGIPDDLRSLEIQFENPPEEILTGIIHTAEDGFLEGHTRKIKLIPGVPHSASVYLYPSYPVTSILIQIDDVPPQPVTLFLNKRLPIVFNWVRLGIILLVISTIYLLRPGSPIYRRKFDPAAGWQKTILAGLLLLQVAFLVFTAFSTYPDFSEAYQKGNLREEDYFFKQHYQLLTEALFRKSLSVLVDPPEALALADNPYDLSQRISQFPDYEWDMSYFDGKYYVYFGIIPALTFYMPYTLLFHQYPLNDVAVLFFAIAGVFGLTACFTILVRKFFPDIPAALYFVGLFMLINSSMITWCVRRPFSYELALVSAFAFSVCGIAFCLSAERKNGAMGKWRSALGCLLLACAVGCRPTAIFASLLVVPVYLPAFLRLIQTGKWSKIAGLLLPVIIPYAVVGSGLMIYNQARFGSVFEFGRTYQLSVQDSSAYTNGLPVSAFLIGIINTIFGNFSRITDSFPFLKPGDVLRFHFDGTKEFHTVFSISSVFPLVYTLFLIPRYRAQISRKGRFFVAFLFLLISLSFLLAGTTGLMVGVIQRYSTDFAWMITLAGLFMLFLIDEQAENSALKKIIHLALLLCLFINVAHVVAISCGDSWDGKSWFEFMNPILFNKIGYLFAFWQ